MPPKEIGKIKPGEMKQKSFNEIKDHANRAF